jgi:hypothetical protein
MRHTILVLAFVLAVGFVAGYVATDRAAAAAPNRGETAGAPGDAATPDAKDTEQKIKDCTFAQKAEFVAEAKKDLAATKTEMDRLSAKVDKANGAAKADAKVKLAAARAKWVEAKKQLDRAESATEADWNDVKNSFTKSYDETKDAFGKARQWISDKIAP